VNIPQKVLETMHRHALTQIHLAEQAQEKGGAREHSYHAGFIAAMRLMEGNLRMVLDLKSVERVRVAAPKVTP
jgi:hypothetical protein